MKSILVLSRSVIASDPRVMRQVNALRESFSIVVAGYGRLELPGVEFVEWARHDPKPRGIADPCAIVRKGFGAILTAMPEPVRGRRWRDLLRAAAGLGSADRRLVKTLRGRGFDLVIANDFGALATAARLKGKGRLLYDAHEYHPGHQRDSEAWRRRRRPLVVAALERFLPACDRVTTVCEGIASAFVEDFRIERPLVITNSPPYRELAPVATGDGPIRLVHHGLASRKRGFELMIEALQLLGPGYCLDLYLADCGSPRARAYIAELAALHEGEERIRILPPMPMPEIPVLLNAYDIGLAFFPPRTFNLLHALPNKFFEYVQARLAVVSGPSPDMADLVSRHGFGTVAKGFSARDLADAIAALDRPAIMRCKRAAHAAARELASEPQVDRLRQVVASLLA